MLFNRYLNLGGIDTSPRMFTGTAGMEKSGAFGEDVTRSDIRAIEANDVIYSTSSRYYNPSQSQDWEVDFTGVVAGYLYVSPTHSTPTWLTWW